MTRTVARGAARTPMPYLLLALAALGLAACEGDTIKRGAEGPSGPSGPPGNPGTPNFPLPAANATALKVQVTSVSVPTDGRPVVNLFITDQQDRAVTGLPAANVYFVLARLESALNGTSSTWHAITRRTEAFPGTPAPQPPQYVTGTGPTNQGYTEPATAGTWVGNGNGTFRYTYKASLTTIRRSPTTRACPPRGPRDPPGGEQLAPATSRRTTRHTRSSPPPARRLRSPAARSWTTAAATPAMTSSRPTATRASTSSTARCATSHTRSTHRPATPSTSR